VSREDAYALVQKHALAAFDGGASLRERAQDDPVITKALSASELDEVFNLARYLKQVDRIINRALA
jgi:adenylosuccinate lyase